jgi:alcohol dehydrogenase class IV
MIGNIEAKIPGTSIGLGSIKNLGIEIQKFDAHNILVITDKGIVDAGVLDPIKSSLDKAKINYEIFDSCSPEPSINLITSLTSKIKFGKYDLLVGVGGGSNMDATKAASVFTHSNISLMDFLKSPRGTAVKGQVIPKILVPTTSGTGSEWSKVAVIYDDNGLGRPGGMDQYFAERVIIDPELTRNLPPKITADTGFDALTHAIEAFTNKNANSFSDALATLAIKLVGQNLQRAYAKGSEDIESRYNMSLAACSGMNAAVTAGMGLCHVLSEYIQSKAHISHGASLAIMLPAVMQFNLAGNPQKFANIAELLGENISGLSEKEAGDKSILAVRKLIDNVKLPKTMKEVGIKKDEIETMAKHCFETNSMVIKMWTPQNVSESNIVQMFQSSF